MLYNPAFLSSVEESLRAALPRWGVDTTAPLSLLTISENATFLVEDRDRGQRVVLRVHRPGYHSEAEIESELAWIIALREAGVVETPRPIPDTTARLLVAIGEGEACRHVVAFEHMSGREPAPADDLHTWYGRLGGITARLHAHSRTWTRPHGFVRKVWNLDSTVGAGALWGDWRAALGLTAEGREVLEVTEETLRDEIPRYGEGADRFGLVHCDMRPANLLVEGDRLGIIDFDDCGLSWFAYDFAAAVSFLEAEPFLETLMVAWLRGYRAVAPFSAEDEAALPMFIMLRRMQLTGWIASHSETPTARAMGVGYTYDTVALARRYLDSHR